MAQSKTGEFLTQRREGAKDARGNTKRFNHRDTEDTEQDEED